MLPVALPVRALRIFFANTAPNTLHFFPETARSDFSQAIPLRYAANFDDGLTHRMTLNKVALDPGPPEIVYGAVGQARQVVVSEDPLQVLVHGFSVFGPGRRGAETTLGAPVAGFRRSGGAQPGRRWR